ncbi:hypothetical protein ACJ41O_008377 [Fusarium nematophilum]
MAELALGALGVVPLITFAFKTSRNVRSKLKAFRHYSDEVSDVHRVFYREQHRFKREYEILLRLVVDEKTVKAIARDSRQSSQTDEQDVEEELREALGSGYNDWLELAKDINDVLDELEAQLECFEILTRGKQEEERLSDAVRRLKRRIQVPFSKTKSDDIVNRLRESNQSLETLREQLQLFQQPSKPSKHVQKHRLRRDWGALCKQRRASAGLHHGLQEVWSCSKAKHANHGVKIFLNMDQASSKEKGKQQQSTVHLEIAVEGAHHEQDDADRAVATSTFAHLQVVSQWIEQPASVPSPSPSSCHDEADKSAPKKRQKRVCFAQDSSSVLPLPLTPSRSPQSQAAVTGPGNRDPDANGSNRTPCDLRTPTDLCYDLCNGPTKNSSCTCYLGFLDVSTDEFLRYHFHSSSFADDHDWKTKGAYPLSMLFGDASVEFASFVDRLKMARATAIAGLAYHSTPWLNECWRLGDLSFLARGYDIPSALRTLHLGVDLENRGAPMQGLLTPSSSMLSQSTEDERLLVGIKNVSLYSLGVALLGIDKWRDFDPDDIVQVRKAAQSSGFGNRYREIVRKCLGCEFRNETDLAQSRLHRAVYEDVVGSLESMIASLELKDDDEDDG